MVEWKEGVKHIVLINSHTVCSLVYVAYEVAVCKHGTLLVSGRSTCEEYRCNILIAYQDPVAYGALALHIGDLHILWAVTFEHSESQKTVIPIVRTALHLLQYVKVRNYEFRIGVLAEPHETFYVHLVVDRNDYRTRHEYAEIGECPLRAVLSIESDLVAFLNSLIDQIGGYIEYVALSLFVCDCLPIRFKYAESDIV